MENSDDESKLRKVANAAILILVSRISVPIIGALCVWILNTVSAAHDDINKIGERVSGIDTRVVNLETWRNNQNFVSDTVHR